MNISFTFKKLTIATAVVAMVVVAFFVYALAGLNASPVVFGDPPAFVAQYASELYPSAASSQSKVLETSDGESNETVSIASDFFNEAALVRNVIINGESSDKLLRLFTHPEKAKRVKIAMAYAAVNNRLNHAAGSDFSENQKKFWKDVEEHYPAIQNAFFEALIMSAKERTKTDIAYTLAWWMPGQERKRDQMLAWAAIHHPDWWVRRSSIYFAVQFGVVEELVDPLLKNRTHDPDYRVRKEVLNQRFRRFSQMLGMADDS